MDTEQFISKYSWMVRPCNVYEEEYGDCSSIRGRVHQYFVFGSTVDCTQWKHDETNCVKWTKEGDIKALNQIVTSEMNRKDERMANHNANDVWSKRAAPPENWNSPLPSWFKEREAGSYLNARAREAKSGLPVVDETPSCTIL